MPKRRILIIGGARSGKSRQALRLAAEMGERVLFVATATAGDDEMRRRIEAHRAHRPAHWRTLEVPTSVGRAISQGIDDAHVVILDCLTLLVSNVMGKHTPNDDQGSVDMGLLEPPLEAEVRELMEALDAASASCVVVSNEVGTGLVAVSPLGRAYRDLLGGVNQRVARWADEVYLMVAGIPVRVKPPPAP